MSKPHLAELLSAGAFALLILVLATVKGLKGPRTLLDGLIVGRDNRTSTSKTVAFAWTIAIGWGLLSLLVAKWLGDRVPWDNQVHHELQEEYLLLLGGPYAAAVLAKYNTAKQADAKPTAPADSASPKHLVVDDQGVADLGDFQYVLFNAIALAFFIAEIIDHPASGFPDLPQVLTGLVLTSAGGYTAKKLVSQIRPALISVIPEQALPGAAVEVFGTGLYISDDTDAAAPLPPTVTIGAVNATITAHADVIGNDRVTVTVPELPEGQTKLTVTRVDGVQAQTGTGVTVLPFTVLSKPVVLKK